MIKAFETAFGYGARAEAQAKAAQREYVSIRNELKAAGLLTAQRARIAERLAIDRVLLAALRPSAAAEGPVSTNKAGEQYHTPIWSAMKTFSAQILQMEKALGLLPRQPRGPLPKEKKEPKTRQRKPRTATATLAHIEALKGSAANV